MAKQFKPSQYSDDSKCSEASYYGGFQLLDAELTTRLRGAGKELIMMAGKKILNGEFDLTKISFPIKCMCPQSLLQTIPFFHSTAPVYLNYAASLSDPLERFKLVIVQSINWYYHTSIFEKPLNPILGETFQTVGQDGAKIYLEQTAHHPPTSNFLVEGPNGNYKYTGWLAFSIKSGLTKSVVDPTGYKQIQFKDGQTIRHNYHKDLFYNIFMGSISHQLFGSLEFRDEANDLYAIFSMNESRWKAQDYFTGEIKRGDETIHKINGNYMGYFDIDGVRYWDIRDKDKIVTPAEMTPENLPGVIPSDATLRTDSIAMLNSTME